MGWLPMQGRRIISRLDALCGGRHKREHTIRALLLFSNSFVRLSASLFDANTSLCAWKREATQPLHTRELIRELRTIRPNMHLAFQFFIPLLQVLVPLDGLCEKICNGGVEEMVRNSKPSFRT